MIIPNNYLRYIVIAFILASSTKHQLHTNKE